MVVTGKFMLGVVGVWVGWSESLDARHFIHSSGGVRVAVRI